MFLILHVGPDVYTDNASCGKADEADGAADGGTGGPGAAADDVAVDGAAGGSWAAADGVAADGAAGCSGAAADDVATDGAADDVAAVGAGAEAATNGDGGEATASTSIINAASGVPLPFLPHVHTAPMSVSL